MLASNGNFRNPVSLASPAGLGSFRQALNSEGYYTLGDFTSAGTPKTRLFGGGVLPRNTGRKGLTNGGSSSWAALGLPFRLRGTVASFGVSNLPGVANFGTLTLNQV